MGMTNRLTTSAPLKIEFYVNVREPQAPRVTYVTVRKASPFLQLARMRPHYKLEIGRLK
jgi:hypothetical protein